MHPEELTEPELAAACAAGDRLAQRELYRRYHRRMWGVCLRYCPKALDAEDLLQTGFVKAYQAIGTYKGASLAGWLRRIFVNQAINHYHRQKRRNVVDAYENPPDMAHADMPDALSQLSADEILTLVATLPDGARMVFNLFAIEGYAHSEIAAQLGFSEGTSRWHLVQARNQLKAKLEKLDAPARAAATIEK